MSNEEETPMDTLIEKLKIKTRNRVYESKKEFFFQELNDYLVSQGLVNFCGLRWVSQIREKGITVCLEVVGGRLIEHKESLRVDAFTVEVNPSEVKIIRVSLSSSDESLNQKRDFPLEGSLVNLFSEITDYLEELVS